MRRHMFFAGVALAVILAPSILQAGWTRTYGGSTDEVGYCVEQTRDSGYIICGASSGPRWNLIKTNQTGDTIWTHHARQSYCVQQTADRGYIVTGEALIEDGKYHIYLEKLDSSGNSIWYRDDLNGVGYSIQQTYDGGYILTGHKSEWISDGIQDLCLIKLDSLGDTVWTKTYGGEGPDWGTCVRQTQDEGYIVVGYTMSALPWSFWVLKTDENGDTLWSSGRSSGKAYSVTETSDGGYIVTGYVAPLYDGKYHLMVLKIDSDGDTLWTRMEPGWSLDTLGGVGRSIQETTDGNYILTGYTSKWLDEINDLFLIKMNPSGDTLWTHIYGGEDEDMGNCVDQTSDEGYIVVGATKSFEAIGYDIWLLKTDANGDTLSVGEEPPVTHVTHPSNWRLRASVGQQIVLQYSNCPQGFHAQVFDAIGQKVDEVHSSGSSGTVTWPATHQSPGVYFIRLQSTKAITRRVILLH